ncbi:non-ribosomal peptide synthetase/type I polyketide synthase [Mariniblastus fucicola]|uniref:Linear gramicidin synthase subunit D n=1 Tax=Mariniblastus fucicola TaxID=980251 RepID=A0A5B9PC53_9BACT|nr:non-ribosomal peptide synthetase/type I polyketide synthase [Mariniblastus fucicola]QEG23834.1 Linear gramicidin synthase subunit D [Mariniblastus fucicola]
MIRQSQNSNSLKHPPLAVVGIGCRFSGGVTDAASLWKLLVEGRSGIVEVPTDRWNRDRFYHPNRAIPGRMISKWGGFLDGLDQFDPQFWGISPREAARMDPQHRWLLEVAWEAIEDGGIAPQKLRGESVGVFVGIAGNDYAGIQMPHHAGIDVHTNSGSTQSIASNRISYLLDLKGPSVSVDTACSSALVAMSQACHSIWSGQCRAALSGGVNAIITPHATIGFSKAQMLSPTGQCYAFDARANGYVRGEGAAMVLIKPLSDAIANGDPVYGVIRSAVVNQDGHTSSMTVPGVEGQSAMLRQAYRDADIEPSHVAYMEAHGTGTPVGDPIEATALGNVLCEGRSEDNKCLVGSVKTNIGHLESGSGIAGFLKSLLVLHHDTVPPNRNFETPNPNIPFERLGLEIANELQPLPHFEGVSPITAVNSFGFGGTNAHVVLEAAPAAARDVKYSPTLVPGRTNGIAKSSNGNGNGATNGFHRSEKANRPLLLPISARDDASLNSYMQLIKESISTDDNDQNLADFCYSAGARKEHHQNRLVVLGRSGDELRSRLTRRLTDENATAGIVQGKSTTNVGDITFVFTGQGAQWWQMGRELYANEPVFKNLIDRIDALLAPLASWSLVNEMMNAESESSSRIHLTSIAQPAIFALQVALAELWKSWGIEPAKVIGHSVGEVAAAYVAGVYTLDDAVKIIFHRSRLQDSAGGDGRMAAVGISASEASEMIGQNTDKLQVAVINSPSMVTIAGDREPLEELVDQLKKDDKFVRLLRINYAFHTHHMDPIREELLDALSDINPLPSRIPFVSTVTSCVLPGEKLDAMYWWRNVRQPVLFASAMSNLVRAGGRLFLELGPHPALESSIMDVMSEQGKQGSAFHSLKRKTSESEQILTNLAGLHVLGMPIDWAAVNQSSEQFVRLPKYPWNHASHWFESEQSASARLDAIPHPLLEERVVAEKPTWQFQLDPRLFDYLHDHQIWDSIVFPGAGYGEIGLAIAAQLFPEQPYVVEELEIKKALFVSEDNVPTVRVTFNTETKTFTVHSTVGKDVWDLNGRGRLIEMPAEQPSPIEITAIQNTLTDHIDHDSYYADFAAAGYQFGPRFRHVNNLWRVPGEVLAEIVVPEQIEETVDQYRFHPAVLDACFHVFKGMAPVSDSGDDFFLPAHVRRIRLYSEQPSGRLWAHARVVTVEEHTISSDILVYDENGNRVADILGFRVDRMKQGGNESELDDLYFQNAWEKAKLRGSRVAGSCEFATTSDIVQRTAQRTGEIYRKHDLANHYHGFAPRIEAVVHQLIENAYVQLGWNPNAGDQFTLEQLTRELKIVPQHYRLVAAQLGWLAEAGLVRTVEDGRWEVLRVPRSADVSGELDALETEYPKAATEVELQRTTGDGLAGVLCGDVDPVHLLFPGGSSDLLESFYVQAFDFPAYTELIPMAVERTIETLPKRRSLRVLEVGAGTGSLTKAVLPILPADQTEYLFTDIGPAFLSKAKQRFSASPFIEYRTLDIERDPSEQEIANGSIDFILATNVLHATADLKNTLANLKSCLAPGGILMFQEVVRRRAAWDNIFGLLEGWWRYTDTDLRPHSALLRREQWTSLLSECGFADAGCFHCSQQDDEAEQAVFVAFAPQPVESADAPPEVTKETRSDQGSYLLFADDSGLANEVASRLRQRGYRPILVNQGQGLSNPADDTFTISATSKSDMESLLAETTALYQPIRGIVHCWSLDHPSTFGLSTELLEKSQKTGVLSILKLAQALGEESFDVPPRVLVVTRGAQHVVEGDFVDGIASSPLVGITRVANNEHPQFRWTSIDLSNVASSHDAEDVVDELFGSDGELELAYRDQLRYGNRLKARKTEDIAKRSVNAVRRDGSTIPYRVETDRPGILTNLSLNETIRRAPETGEVEVQIRAGGINFRDVMKALAMYPGNPVDLLWFGDDFSGTVLRVGEGVTDLQPGDEVAGMAPYSFRAYNTVDRRMVFKKPAHLTFEQAATLSTVFLTTNYAINHLARMQPGEKILIHAGTGGVGQAAIQISQHLGLEIFSTAGTPEKRQMLVDAGVQHVMDSRSLDFADKIMEITQGKGVDAVLNSLAGEFIPKNFSVLAPFGRFLEIGKIDIYNNTRIGLEPLRNNISYFVIDLAQHLEHKPDYVATMFSELSERFDSGDYQPLTFKTFPITEIVEAFRFMAQGKHVGKNVLTFDIDEIPIGPCSEDKLLLRADATYLIVGGASGFGLELAKWMTEHGARNIVLLSRSGPRDDSAAETIRSLQQADFNIVDARGDVTQQADVDRVIAQIEADMPPLKGVVHGAMVLDDEFMAGLNDERFSKVLHPKILGAWNLHTATKDLSLEHFICFSSFSSLVGGAKQSNYNSGNHFLDALAHHRRSLGQPALTINWTALSGAGFVERNEKTAQYLDKLGMKSLTMDEAFAVFVRMIARDPVQIAACRADWQALSRRSPLVANSRTFTSLVESQSGVDTGGAIKPKLLAAAPAQRFEMLQDLVAEQVGGVFGVDPNQVDRETSLTNLGLDSLMAIDLINRVESELGVSVPMGNVLRGPSLSELAEVLMGLIGDSTSDDSTVSSDKQSASTSLAPLAKTSKFGDAFPLTEGQQALWFLYRLAPQSSAYNLTFSAKLTPHIDIASMERAFELLFRRHPMLDVTFCDSDGQPLQRYRRDGSVDFREHDTMSLNGEELDNLLVEHANQPFDLENGPVIRLELFRTNDGHIALMTMHHIISDAWSVTVLFRDLIESYFSIRAGRDPQFAPIEIGYEDFVAWEQEHLASDAGEQMKNWWKQHIDGAPLSIDLPTDHPRPAVQSFRGATLGFKLDEELTHQVLQTAAQQNVTLFTLMLSSYDILLHRYTGQDDFLVGSPMAGRQHPELRQSVGYFVNPVPLRSRVDDDPTFTSYLRRTKETVTSGLEHQQYPFKRMVQESGGSRDTSRSPLFQVAFSMERIPGFDEQGIAVFLIGEGGYKFHLGDMEMESIDLLTRQAQFEIMLVVEEAGGNIYGCWQYNRDLFDAETIERLNEMYHDLLMQLTRNPNKRISQYSIATESEFHQTTEESTDDLPIEVRVEQWNKTETALDNDRPVHEQIEQQALKTPDAIAVVCGSESLTYRELNEKANQLAWHLKELGVGPDVRVGISIQREVQLIVTIQAVLKAGGAYVPLDQSYPQKRLQQITTTAELSVVVTDQAHREKFADTCEHVACFDADDLTIARQRNDNPPVTASAENLMYVIYTSGSTGDPKGAGVYHRGFTNLVDWFRREFEIDANDRSLVVTSHGFDLTQKNLFATLTVGGQVHLTDCQIFDPGIILNEVSQADISLLNCTPSNLYLLLSDSEKTPQLNSLRMVFLGGEPIDMAKLAPWRNQSGFATTIVNTYGPTECTDICSFYRIAPDSIEKSIPVGFPISNVQTWVLDEQLRKVPVGVTGELCIGGVSVGAGYLHDSQLTSEKFVANPFASDDCDRIYRTGDLCRYRENGAIDFIGRVDDQIKIRGNRVELGEIESVLLTHSQITDCAVIAVDDARGNKRLVAFFVANSVQPGSNGHPVEASTPPSSDELKQFLFDQLPSYMVPSLFNSLAQMPLTPHGKVDRRALASIGNRFRRVDYLAPRNETEIMLSGLWEAVLGEERIGVKDGFFDLGGDSMMSIELVIKIRKATGIEVPLAVLLQNDTVAGMANYLSQNPNSAWSPIVPIQTHGDRPPLFCIHPVGGNVLCYAPLADALGDNQPVYGLQARGVAGTDEPLASMELMVEDYLSAIREIQPSGPYHFAAWSSGGIVAYEIARRLIDNGEQVATVALFDSFAPALMRIDVDDDAMILAELVKFLNRFYNLNIDVSYDSLASAGPDERIAMTLASAKQTGFVPEDFDEAYMRRFLSVCKANLRAISQYIEVQQPEVPAVLYRALDPNGRSYTIDSDSASDLGWGKLIGRSIEVIDMNADHVSIISGEEVAKVANDLRERIGVLTKTNPA